MEEDEGINVSYNKRLSKSSSSSSLKKSILDKLGPGIITGASDADPSGIATYSQAGAKFGFGMVWLVLALYPMITAVQEMCARIFILYDMYLQSVKYEYRQESRVTVSVVIACLVSYLLYSLVLVFLLYQNLLLLLYIIFK
jgi:Mn2+/Fe2+ NRAMP family transporter